MIRAQIHTPPTGVISQSMGTMSIGEMSVGIPIHCFKRFTTGTSVLVGRGLVCRLTSSNILCVKKYTLSTNRGKWSHQWCDSLTPNNIKTIGRMTCHCFLRPIRRDFTSCSTLSTREGGRGTLGINWVGICRWDFGLLVYTRPSSAEFCHPILELTPK